MGTTKNLAPWSTPSEIGGGGSGHDLGYFADLTALTTAHVTANAGDYAVLGSTDTMWVWDGGTSAWVDTNKSPSIATSGEINTGTDNAKMITASGLTGSNFIKTTYTVITGVSNTAVAGNGYILNGTSAACTLTLPNPATTTKPIYFVIKDKTNTCTLARYGSEKIDGNAGNLVFDTAGAANGVASDGTDWYLIYK